jgi:hypothetical protein
MTSSSATYYVDFVLIRSLVLEVGVPPLSVVPGAQIQVWYEAWNRMELVALSMAALLRLKLNLMPVVY